MSCIFLQNPSKSYGNVHAVDHIDLEVKSGQVFGFLGPNGAGKSTTIKLLTTLIHPNKGELSILGIDAVKSPYGYKKKDRRFFNNQVMNPRLTVAKSLEKYGMMWDTPIANEKNVLSNY